MRFFEDISDNYLTTGGITSPMLLLFWFSFAFISFTYAGYPLILLIQSKLVSKPVNKELAPNPPFVSIVIAAKNEADRIEQRLLNLLEQDYPSERFEIIVISDGSTDTTPSIVKKLAAKQAKEQPRIICHYYTPSKGKPVALNHGVIDIATGGIIVFADSRQKFALNTVSQLVANFSEQDVGAASGELLFCKECESNITLQMGAYWHYEKFIRKAESMSGSVVGATGAVYAIRKDIYKKLPPATILDDVLTPMNIIMQGYRVIFDEKALAYDTLSKDVGQEWKRKVRTLAGNWQLLSLRPALLSPTQNRLFFRFFCHKLARLLVPVFLVLMLVTSAFQQSYFFKILTTMQFIFYFSAISAYVFPRIQRYTLVQTIYFFCSLNLAATLGFFVWITGACSTIWSSKDTKF